MFEADGGTTYVENGRPTRRERYVDDGRFGSLWPPSYRASYDVRLMVEDGVIVGLRFTELDRGSRFDGRYRIPSGGDLADAQGTLSSAA